MYLNSIIFSEGHDFPSARNSLERNKNQTF
jgi:hypothetical protein